MTKKEKPSPADAPHKPDAQDAEADDAEHPHAEPDPMDSNPVEDPRDAEIGRLKDMLTRARADYDNLQKRVARDADMDRERIRARLLEPFLQVFEYGRMAAAEAEKTPGPLAEGVLMVVREFERTLEAEGVQTIGTVGEPFDAQRHEAVAEEKADGVAPGHVTRVVRPGYLLGDRVLRYARVAVAPASADPRDAPPSQTDPAA